MSIAQARLVLGLSPSFTKEDLKKAYRNMCKKYHPDVNLERNTEDKMKEINSAFDVLKKNVGTKEKTPINFKDVKTKKVHELEEILKNLRNYKINYNKRNIIDLYSNAKRKEFHIYNEYISEIRSCVNIEELKSIEKLYDYSIKCLLTSFAEDLFYIWKKNLTLLAFYKDFANEIDGLKDSLKNNASIDEIFKCFDKIDKFVNEKNNKLLNEASLQIQSKIEEKISKYKSHLYYNNLIGKINYIKSQVFNNCISIRTSFEYQKDRINGEINISKAIDSIDERIEQLFKEYSLFVSKKQEKLNELKLFIGYCPVNHVDKLNTLIDSLINRLDFIEDYNQLDKWFNSAKKEINLLLEQINKLVKEESKKEQINNIKSELLLKFSLLKNSTIEEAQINSSILADSLNCLLSALNGEIKFENALYLKQISFKDIKTDKTILNYVNKKSEYVVMPYVINPRINNERLLNLYGKIKPIIDIDNKKYFVKGLTLDELRNNSYLYELNENKLEEVSTSNLEIVDDFECYHSISNKEIFEPKIADVLAQMPTNLVVNAHAFEIIGVPKLVKDADAKFLSKSYHLSKVRVYSIKK